MTMLGKGRILASAITAAVLSALGVYFCMGAQFLLSLRGMSFIVLFTLIPTLALVWMSYIRHPDMTGNLEGNDSNSAP